MIKMYLGYSIAPADRARSFKINQDFILSSNPHFLRENVVENHLKF